MQHILVKIPSAYPVTSFPSRGVIAIRSISTRGIHVPTKSTRVTIFQCTTSITACSTSIIMSSTVHTTAIPVPCQGFSPVISIGFWIRASNLRVSTILACIPLLEIYMLASIAHPISSWPTHFSCYMYKNFSSSIFFHQFPMQPEKKRYSITSLHVF